MPFSPDHQKVAPRDIIGSGLCIGCGACVAGSTARMGWNRYGQLQPEADKSWLRAGPQAFERICPFSPSARNEDELAEARFPDAAVRDKRIGRYEAAYVGHAAEADFRARGSSGGMVTWIAAELLRQGLVDGVAHVAPEKDGKFFGYRISRSEAEVRNAAKSRYYPIELSDVLAEIRERPGRYAIVGIPCFIKAVQLLRREEAVLRQRIVFTLGLFCGHMKSARLVESFAWQMGTRLADVEAVEYRLKNPDRPANWYTAELTGPNGAKQARDWFHLGDGDWGAGFLQASACNFCDDVMAETADISFGDAWLEPYSSDGRGTNVVVVRNPLLHHLVETARAAGRLALEPVDSDFIARTQAAGLRQRREGLAFRLAWPRGGLRPRKRVDPQWRGIGARRKFIYWMRFEISAWSHRMFWLARRLHRPGLYVKWAWAALTLYHGLAYGEGRLGQLADRLSHGHGKDN